MGATERLWDRACGTELSLGVPHALWKEETQWLPVSALFSPDQLEALQTLTQPFR